MKILALHEPNVVTNTGQPRACCLVFLALAAPLHATNPAVATEGVAPRNMTSVSLCALNSLVSHLGYTG